MVIIRKRSSKMLCSHDSCFLCLDVVWLVVATPLRTRISQVTLLSNLNYSYFLWIIYVDRNMKLVLPTHWGVTFETNPPAHFLFHSLCELMQAMVPPVLHGDNISIRHASAEVEGCHWVFIMFSVLGEAPCQGAACKSICAFLLSDFFIEFLSNILFSILVVDVSMEQL